MKMPFAKKIMVRSCLIRPIRVKWAQMKIFIGVEGFDDAYHVPYEALNPKENCNICEEEGKIN